MPIMAKTKIILSDEVHFDLQENCSIWFTENPHAYIEKPTHPKRVSVSCGFWSRGISAPMSKERPLQSMAIVSGPCWTNFCSQKLKRYWQHLVSTERRYVPHSRSFTRCFAPCFWRSHYQSQCWCRLAISELQFDTVGLLSVTPSSQRQLTL